ncbi:MAG: methyltransferase domain-containing protein, partial [Chrysiogenales bacterium]
MEKPDVDQIEGLSPAISIDQKSTTKNPRSTVGTVTEIYDYLRLLYARIGIPHCPICNRVITKQTTSQIVEQILSKNPETKFMILAPIIKDKKHFEIMEFGCAAGWNLIPFFNEGYHVTGYDYSPSLVEFGRSRGLNLFTGSFQEIIGEYDVIILSHVIEHFTNFFSIYERHPFSSEKRRNHLYRSSGYG